MKRPSKKSIEQLSSIIWKLEAWQNRYDVKEIDAGYSMQAKSELIALVGKLESARQEYEGIDYPSQTM